MGRDKRIAELVERYCVPYAVPQVDRTTEREDYVTRLGYPASVKLGRPAVIGVWVTSGASDKVRWSCLFRFMFDKQCGTIVISKRTAVAWRIFTFKGLTGVRFEPLTSDLLPSGFEAHNIHDNVTELAMMAE